MRSGGDPRIPGASFQTRIGFAPLQSPPAALGDTKEWNLRTPRWGCTDYRPTTLHALTTQKPRAYSVIFNSKSWIFIGEIVHWFLLLLDHTCDHCVKCGKLSPMFPFNGSCPCQRQNWPLHRQWPDSASSGFCTWNLLLSLALLKSSSSLDNMKSITKQHGTQNHSCIYRLTPAWFSSQQGCKMSLSPYASTDICIV